MSDTLDSILQRNEPIQRDKLLPVLQEIQTELGYISEEAVNRVSELTGIPTSKVYGVATFYDQFRFSPQGRYHIKVCNGTSCHINHAASIIRELEKVLKIKPGQTTRDGVYSFETVNCMGACALAPVININGNFVHGFNLNELKEIIEEYSTKMIAI